MFRTSVPAVIENYYQSHDRRDADGALASFAPDATVIDDGVAYVGTERIRSWLMNAASEYTYTRTLTGADDLGEGAYVIHNHLSGDFPGGEVDLRYRVQLLDGLIHRVEIAS
jgi:ketosteroid isomerase-like protein